MKFGRRRLVALVAADSGGTRVAHESARRRSYRVFVFVVTVLVAVECEIVHPPSPISGMTVATCFSLA